MNWLDDDNAVAKELAHALNQVDVYHYDAAEGLVRHYEGTRSLKWSIPYAMSMLEELIESAEKGIAVAREILDVIEKGYTARHEGKEAK